MLATQPPATERVIQLSYFHRCNYCERRIEACRLDTGPIWCSLRCEQMEQYEWLEDTAIEAKTEIILARNDKEAHDALDVHEESLKRAIRERLRFGRSRGCENCGVTYDLFTRREAIGDQQEACFNAFVARVEKAGDYLCRLIGQLDAAFEAAKRGLVSGLVQGIAAVRGGGR